MKKILFIVFVLIANIAQAQLPHWLPSNGLVGWYPFDNSAADLSLQKNNGAAYNITLAADHLGNADKAYQFDGNSSYIEVPDSKSLRLRYLTLSVWIKTDFISGSADAILTKGNKSDSRNESYALTTKDFAVKQNSGCAPGTGWQPTSHFTSLNKWLFMAATYDGDSMRMYINDSLVARRRITGPIDSCVGGTLRFGYNSDANPNYFRGIMDDAAIYNRALSRCELRRLYRQNQTGIVTQPKNVNLVSGTNAQFWISSPGTGLTYQWQENPGNGFYDVPNSGPFSGANTNRLTISNIAVGMTNTLFRCIVTAPGLCPDTSDAGALYVNPMSIRGESRNTSFQLYPNPASNYLMIKAATMSENNYCITDYLGRKLISGKLSGIETQVSIADLAPGVYFLRMVGLEEIYRFAKQ